MTDEDLREAVDHFLSTADDTYEEYERGYIDPDAALRRLETAIDQLDDAMEE